MEQEATPRTGDGEQVCAQAVKGSELKQLVWEDHFPGGDGDVFQHAQRHRLAPQQPRSAVAAKDTLFELRYPIALRLAPVQH